MVLSQNKGRFLTCFYAKRKLGSSNLRQSVEPAANGMFFL